MNRKFAKDRLGERSGKLVMSAYLGSDDNSNSIMEFSCDCGKKIVALYGKVFKSDGNGYKHCGCEKLEQFNNTAKKRVYDNYKLTSKKKNRDFELSFEEFINITSKNCHYCGNIPSNITRTSNKLGEYIYNGIDRTDNLRGYTKENIVPCCSICNKAKLDLSKEAFDSWVKRLTYFQMSKLENNLTTANLDMNFLVLN